MPVNLRLPGGAGIAPPQQSPQLTAELSAMKAPATSAVIASEAASQASAASGGTGGGGSGGNGSGGPPGSFWSNLSGYFKVQPPWATGLGPFPSVFQSANWVRSKFQLMMGDLSGWAYNALIVKGGVVDVTFEPSPGQTLPYILQVAVTMTDPNGNVILQQIASNALATAVNGIAVDELTTTMNTSYQYQVEVVGYGPPTPYSATGPSWVIDNGTYTGAQIYAGLNLTATVPDLAYEGRVTVSVRSSSGPVTNAPVTIAVIDVTTGGGIGLGATMGGSTLTDTTGQATFAQSTSFVAGDLFNVNWTIGPLYAPIKSGTNEVTGSELASGVLVPVVLEAPGGPPVGSADSVLVTVSVPDDPGLDLTGITVGLSVVDPSTNGVIYSTNGATNSAGKVVLPITTSENWPQTITLAVSASKPLSTGKGPQPHIQGSASSSTTLPELASGVPTIDIAAQVVK